MKATAPETCLACFAGGKRLSARDVAKQTGMLIATARNAMHRLAVWQQIKRTEDYDKQSACYVLAPNAPAIPVRAVGDKRSGPRGQSMFARTLRAYADQVEHTHEEAGVIAGVHLITLRTYVKRMTDAGLLEHCGYRIEKTGRVARHRITAAGLAKLTEKARQPARSEKDDEKPPAVDMERLIASAKASRPPLDIAWMSVAREQEASHVCRSGAREGVGA